MRDLLDTFRSLQAGHFPLALRWQTNHFLEGYDRIKTHKVDTALPQCELDIRLAEIRRRKGSARVNPQAYKLAQIKASEAEEKRLKQWIRREAAKERRRQEQREKEMKIVWGFTINAPQHDESNAYSK